MTTTLIATYSDGVFKPETPVDLPENAKVELTLNATVKSLPGKAPVGSRSAMEAFVRHCRESPIRSGKPRPTREELYEGR
jgi:predicted DNA-binding antitoxin AbrB/MazE fold protein